MLIWKLNRLLFLKHKIVRPSQLQRLLRERANYHVSAQTAANLLRGPSRELRLDTVQALCDAAHCNSYDFFEVRPSPPEELIVRLDGRASSPYRRRGGGQDTVEVYPDLDLYLFHLEEVETREKDPSEQDR